MPAKVLQDAKDALQGLNVEKILQIYADEFLFEDTSAKQRIVDRTILREYFRRLFAMPGVSFSDIKVFEAEQFAALEWTWGGVNRSSGELFKVRGGSVMELSEGKVRRESIYYDPQSALA